MTGATASASTSSSDLSKPSRHIDVPTTTEAVNIDGKDFTEQDLTEKDVVEQQDADRAGSLGRELSRIDTSDFPSAFPLAMITIALMLSIFLCALGKAIPQFLTSTKLIQF